MPSSPDSRTSPNPIAARVDEPQQRRTRRRRPASRSPRSSSAGQSRRAPRRRPRAAPTTAYDGRISLVGQQPGAPVDHRQRDARPAPGRAATSSARCQPSRPPTSAGDDPVGDRGLPRQPRQGREVGVQRLGLVHRSARRPPRLGRDRPSTAVLAGSASGSGSGSRAMTRGRTQPAATPAPPPQRRGTSVTRATLVAAARRGRAGRPVERASSLGQCRVARVAHGLDGAGTPVISSTCSTAWCTSRSRPADQHAGRAPARGGQRGRPGVVERVEDHRRRRRTRQQLGGLRRRRDRWRPRTSAGTRSGRPTQRARRRAGRRVPRRGRDRLGGPRRRRGPAASTSRQPRSASAEQREAAVARRRGPRPRRPARRCARAARPTAPGRRCCGRCADRRSSTTVLAAPARAARLAHLVEQRQHGPLERHRQRQAAPLRRPSPARNAGSPASSTSRAS